MAQKGIEDANDILAPTDNKRDLKVRAPLVSGYLSEPSLVSSAKMACRPLSAIRMRASLAGHPARSDCLPHHPHHHVPYIDRGTTPTSEDHPSSRGKSERGACSSPAC